MEYRVVWVHGIGTHGPGYSAGWERSLNTYLQLERDDYVEVAWDDALPALVGARGPEMGPGIELTPAERLAEAEVRAELETILMARLSALAAAQQPAARGAGDGVVEWSELQQEAAARGALTSWLAGIEAWFGDFAKYLISRRLRNAVKERFKEKLRPLVQDVPSISVIAHSWGTVVSYESLLDLEAELPSLRTANLFTLGSPLWMVRRFLEDTSGRKPTNAVHWVNIHARGDAFGAWLSRGFEVDKEYEVPSFGGVHPHSSYFVAGNEAVQKTIIARAIKP